MNQQFANDIQKGLTQKQKSIPSVYFYNERGSWLFQQITQLPEYYLTGCEIAILEKYKEQMLTYFSHKKEAFNLIDLGAGDGSKTKVLLTNYLQQNINFSYSPIDLSTSLLSALSESLDAAFPT